MSRIASTLEAELYRLRASLERIASVYPMHANCETVVEMARTALNRKPAKPAEIEPEPEPEAPAPRAAWTPEPAAPVQENIPLE